MLQMFSSHTSTLELPSAAKCDIIFIMNDLKKNDMYTVEIEGYSSEACGICRVGGRAVFVPRTIVGEMWDIRIVKVTASAVYARPERLIVPSPARRAPECPGRSDSRRSSPWDRPPPP